MTRKITAHIFILHEGQTLEFLRIFELKQGWKKHASSILQKFRRVAEKEGAIVTNYEALRASMHAVQYTDNKKHIEYLEKLKEKNIEVTPLDVYQGINTKILHKCTCGNEWIVSPSSVLCGSKCGCRMRQRKPRKNYDFGKKLVEKGIEVKLIGEYINVNTPTTFLCSCGKEYVTRPYAVLSGSKCVECGQKARKEKLKNTN